MHSRHNEVRLVIGSIQPSFYSDSHSRSGAPSALAALWKGGVRIWGCLGKQALLCSASAVV